MKSHSAARLAAPLVDTHAHVFHAAMPLSETAWRHPVADATVEQYLRELDGSGVHFGVIAAASLFDDYNDYSVSAAHCHKRLRTTVIVPPTTGLPSLRDLDARGVVGIRLQFRSLDQLPDLAGFEYRKLFRRIADLGWHVHLHDEGARLPQSIPLIEASGARLVIDHFGRPNPTGGVNSESFCAVLKAIERGNTWVKVSAAFRLPPLDALRPYVGALMRTCGPERLMWGSDWPFVGHEQDISYGRVISDYHELFPDPQVRQMIDRTALSFYFS